jgi:hypothetical protein
MSWGALALLRSLTGTVGHGLYTGLVGYGLGAYLDPNGGNGRLVIMPAFLAAIFLHLHWNGARDIGPVYGALTMIVQPIIEVYLLYYIHKRTLEQRDRYPPGGRWRKEPPAPQQPPAAQYQPPPAVTTTAPPPPPSQRRSWASRGLLVRLASVYPAAAHSRRTTGSAWHVGGLDEAMATQGRWFAPRRLTSRWRGPMWVIPSKRVAMGSSRTVDGPSPCPRSGTRCLDWGVGTIGRVFLYFRPPFPGGE